jgi:Xaa-Pro aminopeptidase
MRRLSVKVAYLALVVFLSFLRPGARAEELPLSEFVERRAKIFGKLPDGILLLHARTPAAAEDQHGFQQDSSFFYFTGLANQPEAILALDGPRKEARLFVPPALQAFGFPVEGVSLAPGEASARQHGLTAVEPWQALAPFVRKRMSQGLNRLYVDESRRAESLGAPEPLRPVAGEKTLWRRSLAQAFPEARIESAAAVIRELRWVKSPAEIEVLRRSARATAAAVLAGIQALRPGRTQRAAEADVVRACIESGAEGPSFWPWLMSGPNAQVSQLVRSVYDYRHLNRVMQPGELVRVDIGCGVDHYGGDVGRTAPVSGKFSAGQSETWDVLIAAYRAGLAAMRAGVSLASVMDASRRELARQETSLTTDLARRAVRALLEEGGMTLWSIHGVGIDSGETPLPELAEGSVIAFEPMFEVGDDAFYLEDMILVTREGQEILSAGLPYAAAEIETAMRSGR